MVWIRSEGLRRFRGRRQFSGSSNDRCVSRHRWSDSRRSSGSGNCFGVDL